MSMLLEMDGFKCNNKISIMNHRKSIYSTEIARAVL